MARTTASPTVEESAARLAGALAVLRELVHHHAGRLALEPRLEIKGLLAAHLHDDALGATALERRLVELGHPAGNAGPPAAAAALLDAAAAAPAPEAYVDATYGRIKPQLVAGLRAHLETLDPVADEPGLRLVTELVHRQERHVAELPPARPAHAPEPAPLDAGPDRELTVLPALELPAREPYVVAGAAPSDGLHARMHASVCSAELASRTLHEHPEQAWELRADLARLTWDGLRHAAVLDRAMAEAGGHWGGEPVDLAPFVVAYAQDLAGRLAAAAVVAEAQVQIEAGGEPSPGLSPAAAGHLRADAAFHVRTLTRWGRRVLDGDDGAWYERVRTARAAL